MLSATSLKGALRIYASMFVINNVHELIRKCHTIVDFITCHSPCQNCSTDLDEWWVNSCLMLLSTVFQFNQAIGGLMVKCSMH